MRDICEERPSEISFNMAEFWKLFDYKVNLTDIHYLEGAAKYLGSLCDGTDGENENIIPINLSKANETLNPIMADAIKAGEVVESTINMVRAPASLSD
jgi:hypothetical protein